MEKLHDLIFIDIETVAEKPEYEQLDPMFKSLWDSKYASFSTQMKDTLGSPAYAYAQKAGVYAEFAKIVCLSIGIIVEHESNFYFRVKSFCFEDEKALLSSFSDLLVSKMKNIKKYKFVGHNIKEFDFPFIARRMVINKIDLPSVFQLSGKKPWQIPHLRDTMELWKFGDFKNYTSLNLLAKILDVPSPKDDLDGSKVHEVYWKDHDLERIQKYCEKDIFTTAKVYLRLKQIDLSDHLIVETSKLK